MRGPARLTDATDTARVGKFGYPSLLSRTAPASLREASGVDRRSQVLPSAEKCFDCDLVIDYGPNCGIQRL